MNKRLIYHGSYIKIEHPLVNVGRQDLDFGRGFYTTDLREQAVKWARIIQQRRNTSTSPILNTYEIDMDVVEEKGFKQLYFEKYDLDWLEFIVKNRRGENLWTAFDIIEGGIANDSVIDTVDAYMSGLIDGSTALGKLMYNKPNNQICILNQNIIEKCVRFLGAETINI